MKTALRDTICPNCKHKLEVSRVSFTCPGCQKTYNVVNGIPILLKDSHLAMQETDGLEAESGLRKWLRRLFEVRPDPHYSTATKTNVRYLTTLLDPEAKLLFVGGGISSHGKHMYELGETLLNNCINLEIAGGPIVDLVADGHDIPFPDNYFDGIICQAVLEHTRDSNRVVAEMRRVLKPNGIVYAEIPFLYPVHMWSDFRRFTLMGIRELFSAFEMIKSGVNGSVASAFTVISIHFFATLFSFGYSSLYQTGRFVFGWLFAPIKYLDVILCRFSTAPISASATYFMGRKPNP
jgi:SAM-dependent methyltransferase